MTRMRYIGEAHFRVLLSSDFKSFGVDSPELHFPRHEKVEVEEEVAAALMSHLPGEFEVEPTSPSDAGWAPAFDSEDVA